MNKAEFIEAYGHRYSRCNISQEHNEHLWESPAYLSPANPPDELWWCSGERIDFEEFTGFKRAVSKHDPEPVRDGLLESLRAKLNRPDRPTSREAVEDLDRRARERGERWQKVGDTEDGEIYVAAMGTPEPDVDSHVSVDPATGTSEVFQRPTSEVVRWADRAMFKAEPMPEGGPRVDLLWMTPDPLGAIAAACKMYKGEVVRDLSRVTDAERLEYLAQVQKTKLKAPFEFVKFHFLIEGVTRSFTHQMVRQRTAVYAQESLRFAVKGGEDEQIPVGLPPSLAGTDDWASAQFMQDVPMTTEEKMRQAWEDTVNYIDEQYGHLIDLGMPAEDARGLLPHNTLTRLHYSTDLRALLDHAGNRLCTQAQVEWRLVFAKIVEAIRNVDINPNDTEGHNVLESNGLSRVYMADKLAEMFKPVCYQTGKCEFLANFDRYCSIRERVTEHARKGEPSETWNDIKPGEWLVDPNSAREPNR